MDQSFKMRKAIISPKPSDTEPIEKYFEGSNELLNPEETFCDNVLTDIKSKGLVTLSLGRNFAERTELTKKDVERFTMLYEVDKSTTIRRMACGIIPLRKVGYPWESYQSSLVRRAYKDQAKTLIRKLDLINFSGAQNSQDIIELMNVPYKTLDYLEFPSAAAIVDKKPYKRKGQFSGDAVYFKEFYIDGKRALLFGLFDGMSNKKNTDALSSSSILNIFKRWSTSLAVSTSELEIFQSFTNFINLVDRYVSEKLPPDSGSTITIGFVWNNSLYYMNIGDSRIYGISTSAEISVKKFTRDDGMAGLVESGANVNPEEFFKQLTVPEFYAGSFSQRSHNGMVFHNKISLKHPNIGVVDLKECDYVLVASDGFWSNLPIIVNSNSVLDASCVVPMEEILKGFSGNTKNLVNLFYEKAKLNMNLSSKKKFKNSLIKPCPQDISILAFAV